MVKYQITFIGRLKGAIGICYTITPNGSINLDGACGLESMLRIAEAIGLDVEREYNRQGRNRGETLGWYVSEKEQA